MARGVAATLATVAGQRPGCMAVKLAAVARAIRDYPKRDYAQVAGEVEHWVLFGNGQRAECRDIVKRYRNFLGGSPELALPVTSGAPSNVTRLPVRREHPASARIRELGELAQRLREEGK